MKKGKKMPSIELEGHSDARFILKDGKIIRQEGKGVESGMRAEEQLRLDDRAPKRPGE